jgi:hypothetical protein
MGAILWLIFGAVAMGTGAARPAMTPQQRAVEKDRVSSILEVQCGACHLSTSPTRNPKALKIFDLTGDWVPEVMRRSESVMRRLEARRTMTGPELKEMVPPGMRPPPAPTERDVARVRMWLMEKK